MGVEENKALINRYYEEFWNKGNFDLANEFLDSNYVYGQLHGPEEMSKAIASNREVFADLQLVIEDMIGEGDRVVCRWVMNGIHQGTYLGVSATGKKISLAGVSIHRIKNDKIVESWSYWDNLGFKEFLQGE